jgi:hypothetical protein
VFTFLRVSEAELTGFGFCASTSVKRDSALWGVAEN